MHLFTFHGFILVSSGLGLSLVILVLVLRIWSFPTLIFTWSTANADAWSLSGSSPSCLKYACHVVSVYPTATPTPRAYQYVVATGCVSALLILLLCTMVLLIYLLYYQHRKAEEALYRHEPPARHQAPYTFRDRPAPTPTGSTSFNSGSSKSTAMTAAQFGSAYGLTAAQYASGGSQSSLSIKQPPPTHHSIV